MKAVWIKSPVDLGDSAYVFFKNFSLDIPICRASLTLTCVGIFQCELNGVRIGDEVMAPGWTDYRYRLQTRTYNVTALLKQENRLTVTVGKGWFRSPLPWKVSAIQRELMNTPCGLAAEMILTDINGGETVIHTDSTWKISQSPVRFAEIYDGEVYDANFVPQDYFSAVVFEGPNITLEEQQGEPIVEQEHFEVARVFKTPKGETVLDFGQEFTGYPEILVKAKKGEKVKLSFGEMLDSNGNFYNANYREAKCRFEYTCREGEQRWHPHFTFYSFRYVRVDEFPGGTNAAKKENFTGIAVYSDLKRTGHIRTSNPKLNRLIDNVFWGQRCNFLDVPTDCPQRNERLGWTGDAQVFAKAACLNFDCDRFFTKWLTDLALCQREDGFIPQVVPDVLGARQVSAAWEDAAVICPWELYLAYGNKKILEDQFASMCKWVDYITANTTTPNLWTGGDHHGDWLGLDAPEGDRKGASDNDLIATAFYAFSTSIVIKAGKVLSQDVTAYEDLYKRIVKAFRRTYTVYKTQTECVVAAYFDLAQDPAAITKQLVGMLNTTGHLTTGFVGTPYLLPLLSRYGYNDLAYSLLLREKYPSWLYCVNKGATTIWEHWDGLKEDGTFWDEYMNSFNHYAYGSVIDWIYRTAGGICYDEEAPGYKKVTFAPVPDARLDWLEVQLDTRNGRIFSGWYKRENVWEFCIETPVETEIIIAGKRRTVSAGRYHFYSDILKGNKL